MHVTTSLEAFKAMRRFLEDYYYYTACDDVCSILSWTQLLKDESGTWDPAMWHDWERAVGDQKNLTDLQAYNVMLKFLEGYASRGAEQDFHEFLESLQLMPQGGSRNPERWEKWVRAIEVTLEGKE
jgi:hypothetical protein